MAEEAHDREPEDEPRKLTPFRRIDRGQDTIDEDNDIVFADFSPRVLPADVPDEAVSPKGESAPGPAPSSDTTQTEGDELAGTAQTPASKAAGSGSPKKSGSQDS